jgi:hypothetical protein
MAGQQVAAIRSLLTESEEDNKEAFKRIDAAQDLLATESDKTVRYLLAHTTYVSAAAGLTAAWPHHTRHEPGTHRSWP